MNTDTRPVAHGIIDTQDSVTDVVLAAMNQASNARLREIMGSFVRYLHAFAREVRLTETEYDLAIDFLNRIGKATHDAHNEGILFADAVGFSTLRTLAAPGQGSGAALRALACAGGLAYVARRTRGGRDGGGGRADAGVSEELCDPAPRPGSGAPRYPGEPELSRPRTGLEAQICGGGAAVSRADRCA